MTSTPQSYPEWAQQFPEAAAALEAMQTGVFTNSPVETYGKSEAWAQQQVRFKVAQQGASAWRNNVGATPDKVICEFCGAPNKLTPLRYGLANDSQKLNKKIKSSDLILAIPRRITREHVGQTIAQFGSIECKRPGWVYTGKEQEPGQQNWIALINRIGGFAAFSTGDITL